MLWKKVFILNAETIKCKLFLMYLLIEKIFNKNNSLAVIVLQFHQEHILLSQKQDIMQIYCKTAFLSFSFSKHLTTDAINIK